MTYLTMEPRDEADYFDAPAIPTVVVRVTDHPMAQMPQFFDRAFAALFPALAEEGIEVAGPAFSLHSRMPTETADLEVGVPVVTPLTHDLEVGEVTLLPSTLPPGPVAVTSYHGGYEGLAGAWGDFMEAVGASGRSPDLPFWEVYVSEPSPEADPATLRTDLYTSLR